MVEESEEDHHVKWSRGDVLSSSSRDKRLQLPTAQMPSLNIDTSSHKFTHGQIPSSLTGTTCTKLHYSSPFFIPGSGTLEWGGLEGVSFLNASVISTAPTGASMTDCVHQYSSPDMRLVSDSALSTQVYHNLEPQQFDVTTRAITDLLMLLRLPTQDLSAFEGDPLQCPSWRSAFSLLFKQLMDAICTMYILPCMGSLDCRIPVRLLILLWLLNCLLDSSEIFP
ncbi:hypothetical protein ElyMa_005502600 [Elysia marginata]|uniref:Uncharacterized protein n=1 Tax=Elysia marginata TaxID=1093978 RepID=A0AAV4EUI4_9GAST|nr:hypothetical protein ElyMa_005502600 [Elysia marginata]